MPGEGSPTGTVPIMAAMLIGYARCSTDNQDLAAQRDGLAALGVDAERIYVDYADVRVMPTGVAKPLARRVTAFGRSA